MRGSNFNTIIFVVSLLLGLYLLNSSFLWIKLPEQVGLLNSLIDGVAGAVLIFLGISYSLMNRHRYSRGYY